MDAQYYVVFVCTRHMPKFDQEFAQDDDDQVKNPELTVKNLTRTILMHVLSASPE
jgi:hypothetical protein